MIDFFRGQYRFLSNFYPCKVTLRGVLFESVESAYQAAKAKDYNTFNKFIGTSAKEAKALGRKIDIRSDWDSVKLSIMCNLLLQKFRQPELKQLLLSTGNQALVEGNTWGDTYWGVCNGEGENNLGRLLMAIRERLKEV